MSTDVFSSEDYGLRWFYKIALFIASLIIVALGQPATYGWLGLFAAGLGYAGIWRVMLSVRTTAQRFWTATIWYTLVQMIQLNWAISHPYLYIYMVWFTSSFVMGLQFGIISLLISPNRLFQLRYNFAVAAGWTLMEWLRLFILSGSSWNPSGLAFASNLYSMQLASIWGVYGLSFWLMIVNQFALRFWLLCETTFANIAEKASAGVVWIVAFGFPFVLGMVQVAMHDHLMAKTEELSRGDFFAVLIQTNFPVEEIIPFETPQHAVEFVADEWRQILTHLKPYYQQRTDLIVTPEYVVPFGTFFPIFKHQDVVNAFTEVLGEGSVKLLPHLEPHLAYIDKTIDGPIWMVNNAYWAQAIANVFKANVIVGLEDKEFKQDHTYNAYNAAYYMCPRGGMMQRYEKRVLVPMAEYIPFTFCREMAACYGITGSFACGTEAKVMQCGNLPVGLSVCYEETYGHLMRENRLKGAAVLINLTNDGWYPNSTLPSQHLEHARLRTVEMGIPLIRSCNTGITGAVDCLGRDIVHLKNHEGSTENIAGALRVKVPAYTYNTVYTYFGDYPILLLSGFSLLFALGFDLIKRR